VDSPSPITVLIADPHTLYHKELISSFALEAAIQVVGETGESAELKILAAHLQPRVILIDHNILSTLGVGQIRPLRQSAGNAVVIVYSLHYDEEMAWSVVNEGACSYVLKEGGVQLLLDTMECALTWVHVLASGEGECVPTPDLLSAHCQMCRKHFKARQSPSTLRAHRAIRLPRST
jgi:NarL family two-component system response regulator LiaR